MPDESGDAKVTIARGKTYPVRALLHEHGFRWNGTVWVKDPALDEADRFIVVKSIRRAGHADVVEVRNVQRKWLDLC